MSTPQASASADSPTSSAQPGAAIFSANLAPPTPPRRINPWRMFLGAFVPNWLLLRTEVSPGAKLCYARLAQFSGQANDCHPKQETLAAELAVSARTANDYLRELRRHRLLEWERLGLGRANRYFFLDHPWIHEGPALRAASGPTSQEISDQQPQTSSAPIEEENQGRESDKGGTHTTASRAPLIPSSEEEAVKSAALDGVPADFARAAFNRLEGVGWKDGCGRAVRNWRAYLKARWAREQAERAERAARPPGSRRAAPNSALKTVHPEQFTGTVGKL